MKNHFPIVLTIDRAVADTAIARLQAAGVVCELTDPPPILGPLMAPDEEGWQSFSRAGQPDQVGIKVYPDPHSGVRLSQEELERIMEGSDDT